MKHERFVDRLYIPKMVLCYIWGAPWVLAGLAVSATVIGIPLGLILMFISGMPLGKVQQTHLRRKREWQNRDRAMPNDAIKPWLTEVEDYANDRIEPDA